MRDSAVLMGFGSEWRLPKGSRTAQRGVGHALCVAMSKALVQAAVALQDALKLSDEAEKAEMGMISAQRVEAAVTVAPVLAAGSRAAVVVDRVLAS